MKLLYDRPKDFTYQSLSVYSQAWVMKIITIGTTNGTVYLTWTQASLPLDLPKVSNYPLYIVAGQVT
jgi:uncharacterized protein (UPF0261 family)